MGGFRIVVAAAASFLVLERDICVWFEWAEGIAALWTVWFARFDYHMLFFFLLLYMTNHGV